MDRKSAIIGARSSRLHEICGLDLDVLRKSEAPGVVMPNSTGMSAHDTHAFVSFLAKSLPNFLGMRITEMCLANDKRKRTLKLATKLVLAAAEIENPNYHKHGCQRPVRDTGGSNLTLDKQPLDQITPGYASSSLGAWMLAAVTTIPSPLGNHTEGSETLTGSSKPQTTEQAVTNSPSLVHSSDTAPYWELFRRVAAQLAQGNNLLELPSRESNPF